MIRLLDLSKLNEAYETEFINILADHIRSSEFIAGNSVLRFERDFASYTASDYCISCANGTDAIEIVLQSLNLDSGDEVIVPAMTWISTAEAVCRQGLKPVFCDVDNSLLMAPEMIEPLINKNTKAVILVHLYGNPSNAESVHHFCQDNNLILIEDCAQAQGARSAYKHVGNFGIAGTFSFFPGKNLGALGDAGCIVSNSPTVAANCRQIRNHGQTKKHHHHHSLIGRNSRLDSLQASFLSSKLKYLDKDNQRRRDIADLYIKTIPSRYCLPVSAQHHVYHQFVLLMPNRDNFVQYMRSHGIETAIQYPSGLPFMDVFLPYLGSGDLYPNCAQFQSQIVSIPVGPHLTDDEVGYVQHSLTSYFRGS